jgi:hypothetical protein
MSLVEKKHRKKSNEVESESVGISAKILLLALCVLDGREKAQKTRRHFITNQPK